MTVPALIKEKAEEAVAHIEWRGSQFHDLEREALIEYIEEAMQDVADLAYKKGKKSA